MIKKINEFIKRYDLFILTTHDPADADGLGAQMVIADILAQKGKKFRIINSSPIPEQFKFMDSNGIVECWDDAKHGLLVQQAGIFMVDTSDIDNIGLMKGPVRLSPEIFVIDHHELKPNLFISGICKPNAASTSEIAVEIAQKNKISLSRQSAFAAYIGIAYDTGFFAYPKTSKKTFNAVQLLLKQGVKPDEVYKYLYENSSLKALELQKRVISNLSIHGEGKIAVQIVRTKDFMDTGAKPENTDGFVNFPLRAHEIIVSILLKEMPDGKVRCSLRSKGKIDVSKLAHGFGGGGHFNAAGYKTDIGIEQALEIALDKIKEVLNK